MLLIAIFVANAVPSYFSEKAVSHSN